MTDQAPDRFADVYELALAGRLGPVLRRVFRPCGASAAHVCTVVRTAAPPDVDLVDLMGRLDAHGLQVEAITRT